MKKSFKSQPWLPKWQPIIALVLVLLIVKVLVLISQHQKTPPGNFQTLEAMTNKSLYDTAYAKAKKYFTLPERVQGAVLGANLKNKEEIAAFFQRLQENQQYQTIVLLTPFQDPTTTFAVSNYAYKTPYGTVIPEMQEIQTLPISHIAAKREVWPSIVAPFIAKSFPQTTYLPIFVNEKATPQDLEKLAATLHKNLPEDSLIIAQTTSKTSNNPAAAEYQLKFTENILENFDHDKLPNLPVASTVTIDLLQKYLELRHAQHVQNQFMDATNGNFISFAMSGPPYQSRSTFIVAFGDLMFDRVVRSLMDTHTLDYPFEKMDKSYLQSNDILVANLEGPIAKKRIITSKSIAFRFAPDVVPLLQKYFFDALSEANNHARDMGDPGFNDTFDLLAPTGIKVFGDPREVNDRSTAIFEDSKVVFLGLEEVVYDIDDAKAVAKIQELTAKGYKVIPFLHWGIEYQHKPTARQQELAHKFIDAGAIAVIGCHPHVVETYETYKNRPIFYSLGNAIFDQYFSPDTQEGLSIGMILSNDQLEIYFLPIKIDHSQMRLMTTTERALFLTRFATYGDYATEAERQSILQGKLTIKLN